MLPASRFSLHLLIAVFIALPLGACASKAPPPVVDVSTKQVAADATSGSNAQAHDDEPGVVAQVSGPDMDGDGLVDADDRCPDEPEDFDAFADKDGCPDIDNDQDGIVDAQDKCPNVPETMNGFEDADGCPDANIDRAKLAFRDGATAFAQADYATARRYFEEAYNLEPRDALLFNIANAADKQGDRTFACQYYRRWQATPTAATSYNRILSLETCP